MADEDGFDVRNHGRDAATHATEQDARRGLAGGQRGGQGVGLAKSLQVAAGEAVFGDGGMESVLQPGAGVVLAAVMDGQGRGDVRGGATERGCGLDGIAQGDDPVGAMQKLGGLVAMVGDGSHVDDGSWFDGGAVLLVAGCLIRIICIGSAKFRVVGATAGAWYAILRPSLPRADRLALAVPAWIPDQVRNDGP